MESKPLSERINGKKLIFLIWATFSILYLLLLRGELGDGLLEGNLIWDAIIVLSGLVSLFFVSLFAALFLSGVWAGLEYLKNWLFDK
jgi:hypothetical protein